jgi:hypothetical protein
MRDGGKLDAVSVPVPWEAEAEIEDLHGDDAVAGAAVDVGRGEEERLRNFSLGVVMAGVRVESTLLFRRMCGVSTGSSSRGKRWGSVFTDFSVPKASLVPQQVGGEEHQIWTVQVR